MKRFPFLLGLTGVAVLAAVAFGTRQRWLPLLAKREAAAPVATDKPAPAKEARILELSEQARLNLELVAKPAKPQSYWRTILIPGEVADRPGVSDRGVTSPAVAVVTQVHAFPGDTIRAGQPLFTLRLFSEYLQNTQSELFKAIRETELVKEQASRLQEAVKSGAIPEAKVIELNNQIRRQSALITAYRQDLLTRGLLPAQIDEVTEGKFVSTIDVVAPPAIGPRTQSATTDPAPLQLVSAQGEELVYEVQELAVELGQQVQAGQLLAKLSNHQSLYVVGHAFKTEAGFLEKAAQEHRPINIEFTEDESQQWPVLDQQFEIRHLANTLDTTSRTFDFFIPLTNQSRGYQQGTETFLVWRFRPGQRARLHVPVEEYKNVYVLPAAAIVREGPEAFVFRQNGNLFDRRSVHVLHEDRRFAVIANDGNVTPGMFLAQSAAASLNRVLKAQAASGEQPGLHVHPDGTVHAAH
jgi:cobalt-zinc-cadmium efflux system membrane fusion protein